MISPVRTSVMMPAAAIALNFCARRDQLVAQSVLYAQVDRKFYRLLVVVGGKAGAVQVGKTAAVEPLLDAGNALVVDVDVADDVRDFGAASDRRACSRSGSRRPAVPRWWTSFCCFGVISRRSQTKPRLEDKPLAQIGAVQIGDDGRQQFARLVRDR